MVKVLERNDIRRVLAATILAAAVLARSAPDASAQEVRNTSYVTKSGERVLRIETVVPTSKDNVWKAWTVPQELSKWIAPVAAIDLKIGGTISTNYDEKATIGNPGTIQLPIINYIEKQLITLKVNLNEKFPIRIRDEDHNLQEIVQIVDLGDGKTKVVSSMVGWGTGKDWDQTYDFFARGNKWTYRQLAKYLSVTTAAAAPSADPSREHMVKIVAQLQRADYEGDRAGLKRLYDHLVPIPADKKLASRVFYWRGFALWRRAMNGFNESVDTKELEEDLRQAVTEFDESMRMDPGFVDPKVGAISCLSNLLSLNQKSAARVQELVAQAVPLRKEAEAAEPENPRLLWVLGPICWYAPPERGCSQDKAMEMERKGLEAARKQKGVTSDPLEPSWGSQNCWRLLHGPTCTGPHRTWMQPSSMLVQRWLLFRTGVTCGTF